MADDERATFMLFLLCGQGTVFYMQCNEANPFSFHMHHTKPSYADLFHITLLLTVAVECE